MNKSIKNVTLFLGGIIVTGFITLGATILQDGGNKPHGKPWHCPESDAKVVCPITPEPGILRAGRDVYNEQCKSCHGKTGKGDGAKSKNLDIAACDFTTTEFQKHSDGEIFWYMSEGRKPMPTHKFKLSETDRWTLVLYLRALPKGGIPESSAK